MFGGDISGHDLTAADMHHCEHRDAVGFSYACLFCYCLHIRLFLFCFVLALHLVFDFLIF